MGSVRKPLWRCTCLAGLLLALVLPQWLPLGLSTQAGAQAGNPTIVAIGDSIVVGLHDQEGRGGWVGRLRDMLHRAFPARDYRVGNAGINGDTSAGVLRRLDRDVIAQQPSLVIVAIGTNDFDYGVPLATFQANLRAILRRLQARTHAAILVQSFLPETRVSDEVLRREAAYNATVPQICRDLHAGYLDLFNTFLALGRTTMANLRFDSEHPTAAGYRFIAAETAAIIEGAYVDAAGDLLPVAPPPGLDDLLPDDSLNVKTP